MHGYLGITQEEEARVLEITPRAYNRERQRVTQPGARRRKGRRVTPKAGHEAR